MFVSQSQGGLNNKKQTTVRVTREKRFQIKWERWSESSEREFKYMKIFTFSNKATQYLMFEMNMTLLEVKKKLKRQDTTANNNSSLLTPSLFHNDQTTNLLYAYK